MLVICIVMYVKMLLMGNTIQQMKKVEVTVGQSG